MMASAQSSNMRTNWDLTGVSKDDAAKQVISYAGKLRKILNIKVLTIVYNVPIR